MTEVTATLVSAWAFSRPEKYAGLQFSVSEQRSQMRSRVPKAQRWAEEAPKWWLGEEMEAEGHGCLILSQGEAPGFWASCWLVGPSSSSPSSWSLCWAGHYLLFLLSRLPVPDLDFRNITVAADLTRYRWHHCTLCPVVWSEASVWDEVPFCLMSLFLLSGSGSGGPFLVGSHAYWPKLAA